MKKLLINLVLNLLLVVIQSSGGLSKDEIENMVKNAEQYAAQDKEKKERVEASNQAEGVVHDIESKITEYESQLPPEEVTKIRDLITKTREALAKKEELSGEELKATTNELQQASLKVFELAYKKVNQCRLPPIIIKIKYIRSR